MMVDVYLVGSHIYDCPSIAIPVVVVRIVITLPYCFVGFY